MNKGPEERQILRRFKPYPAYKDSGVEWLEEIPAHWEVKRLKHAAPIRRKMAEKTGDAPYLGLEHIESWTGRLLLDAQPETVESVVVSFTAGDVLFGKLRPYLAKVARPDFSGVCTSELVVMNPTGQCSQEYLFYCLLNPTFIRWIDSLTYGTKMPRVSPDHLAATAIPLPPTDEQRAIVAFLDRETAKIDALVAKKQRLIELLQEKRTALITRAVTKGLDPEVPMKDSGVEWLGEIPAHWEVTRLKRLGSLQAGAGFPEEEQGIPDEELPFFKVGDMVLSPDEKHIETAPNSVSRQTARRLRAFIFPAGAIVFPKVGAALKLNRRRILTTPSCIDNNMMGFIPGSCDHNWAFYWLSGLDLGELANPGAVPSVNEGQVRELPVAIPPDHEQRTIAAFLDRETAKIDALIAKIREGVERLKEYRTALISAAVTGKIDVRDEAAS
ncbi:MAG TPA: restriction endonuclease subunit S [Firmicutes bacterium]|nr:restriction endonuclease subunit S [Bacillota bacterium]